MSFTFLDVLVLLGIILSLFLVVLIFSSKSFRSDVHAYFAWAIASLSAILIYSQFEHHFPPVTLLELISWEFLFPFAFTMYVLKAIRHPLGISRKVWWLSIPFVGISLSYFLDFFFDFDLFYWLSGSDPEVRLVIVEFKAFTVLIFAIALVGFSFIKIKQATGLYGNESRWLQINSLFLLTYLCLWLLGDPISVFLGVIIWDYMFVILAIFLIAVSYQGIHHLNISEQRRRIHDLQINDASRDSKKGSGENHNGKKKLLTSQKTLDKIQKLQVLMVDDQLFLDPHLTRTIVAERLDISEGYLSELVKSNFHKGFNDFVNEFRVNHAIKIFHNRQYDLFSIEAIGFESGFKSKSVFYSAFNKVTQKTPGDHRNA